MSRSRFFLSAELDEGSPVRLSLSDEDLHHAVRVLRLAPGEEIDVVAPSGAAWRTRVVESSGDGVLVDRIEPVAASWHPKVGLFQGVAKGEKMDTIVRQAVEVGALEIVPVLTSRSVVRFDKEKADAKVQRWRRVARSAAEQARRESVPDVADPVTFPEALERLRTYDGTLVLWEDHRGRLLSAAARTWVDTPDARIALFVGPEGGLSAEEIEALVSEGALVTSLGPSILRTETAAIVALGLAMAAMQEAGASHGC